MFLSLLRAKQSRGADLSVQAGTALVALCCSPLAAIPVAAGTIDSGRLPVASANAATNPLPASLVQSTNAVGTNSPVRLEPVVVTGDLDAAREQIAPSLGAVAYKIGANQIQSMGQGENSSFQQVLLHAPGVAQDEFGEVHVRGDHGDVQYRVNGVLLPEGLNGFGQEIDPHLINSVSLITGTLPAQFGDRTAGIIGSSDEFDPGLV
jgi:hypothetical protein